MISNNAPSLSIVVEWENAKNSDVGRGRAMLMALIEQLRGLPQTPSVPPEMFLMYDGDDGDAATIMEQVRDITAGFPGQVTALPCHGLDYYEQKNAGADRAKNEAILFVDCDIIPSQGWLKNLLDCYVEEKADVVCGVTHMEEQSLYEKAFALFWFFPLPSEMKGRQSASRFFANNVLFRAEVFKNTPFPDAPLVRGKCLVLAKKLQADGRSICMEPRAMVLHPAPNGVRHFIKRALCSGQDNVLLRDDVGVRGALRRFRWQIKAAVQRIAKHHREVGLGACGAIAAMVIAATYIGLECAGELISLINPRLIRNNLRV